MTEREKMLAGELYDPGDTVLLARWHQAKDLASAYNLLPSADVAGKERLLGELLGGFGKGLWITSPFYVDYGENIFFGDNCEVNMGCTFLDDNVIRIGDNALIGAGSVVTRDVPSDKVAFGNPCRVYRDNI